MKGRHSLGQQPNKCIAAIKRASGASAPDSFLCLVSAASVAGGGNWKPGGGWYAHAKKCPQAIQAAVVADAPALVEQMDFFAKKLEPAPEGGDPHVTRWCMHRHRAVPLPLSPIRSKRAAQQRPHPPIPVSPPHPPTQREWNRQ
ncbi:hypothetical protein WJX72_005347 [[Myrmecia] bisecta]|uniref:Uncharacterized protein n=1 Tax=[Myrmecia] bisecta TaxID=41462 RepID=A0AAW1Q0B5_9CHLO